MFRNLTKYARITSSINARLVYPRYRPSITLNRAFPPNFIKSQSQIRFYKNEQSSKEETNSVIQSSTHTHGAFFRLLMKLWKQKFSRYILVIGTLCALFYTAYTVASLYSNITFNNVIRWGFWTGWWSALGLVAVVFYFRKLVTFRTQNVYKYAFQRVLNHQKVQQTLGTPIKPGKFRAYGYEYRPLDNEVLSDSSLIHVWNSIKRMMGWKSKSLQMMFQLHGTKRMGMVSLEVTKKAGLKNALISNYDYKSLVVDVFEPVSEEPNKKEKPKTEQIRIVGSAEDVVYRGEVKLR